MFALGAEIKLHEIALRRVVERKGELLPFAARRGKLHLLDVHTLFARFRIGELGIVVFGVYDSNPARSVATVADRVLARLRQRPAERKEHRKDE